MDFDVVPYEDIVWGERIGGGSFGSVYKGQYLGVDIAIKEIHSSTEYDVSKYFEREWRIMRECRHPNIVLFLGLSKEPTEDGRVFIVTEFVPRGNLRDLIRSYEPFPWRLRLSFATDLARAVAYLHARQCLHRDLKGENLLITGNDRIKVGDFGFARITGRNDEEMSQMTYCGTDGYMSPEVNMGDGFDLPTDVFSVGIIYIEILTRTNVTCKLWSPKAPTFVPDAEEVRRRASPGCPAALIDLALECCRFLPTDRPSMPEVLTRLRAIELGLPEVDTTAHVGSVRFVPREGKRASLPVFDQSLATELKAAGAHLDDEDIEHAIVDELVSGATCAERRSRSLAGLAGSSWRTTRWTETSSTSRYCDASEMNGRTPLLRKRVLPADGKSEEKCAPERTPTGQAACCCHCRCHTPGGYPTPPPEDHPLSSRGPAGRDSVDLGTVIVQRDSISSTPSSLDSALLPQLHVHVRDGTATTSGEAIHRFTLHRVPPRLLNVATNFALALLPRHMPWGKERCSVCRKRLGPRAALQCDDCGLIVHAKCSCSAPRNCATFDDGGID
ncbi:hypothetical protein Q8F55_003665 [Vanrija albida]|uniref:Protein kinase domain-containing protein n=1 Tax=Vanrija albida TaxID=181172 RepID=A0ABR3Q4L3_9TREE